jgi:hypothetical protein
MNRKQGEEGSGRIDGGKDRKRRTEREMGGRERTDE